MPVPPPAGMPGPPNASAEAVPTGSIRPWAARRSPRMTPYRVLAYAPLLALLSWAAVQDVRTRRIRNWLTFSLALCGLAQSFAPNPTVAPMDAALGLLTGFALTVPLFAIGALGGGDVKLMAAIGAWLGPWPALQVFLGRAVVGMVIVLCQAGMAGRL